MHKLLKRQLKRHGYSEDDAVGFTSLMASIDEVYREFDDERDLLERSLDVMSDELNHKNRELRDKLVNIQEAYQQVKKSEELIQHQVFHDDLTGLPNRILFFDRLEHALSVGSGDGGLISVLFLDLDYFKKVNDAAGHHIGDELLVEVSKRIQGCLRDSDTLARFGGDEFVVLLECVSSHQEISHLCQKIIETFTVPFVFSMKEFYVSSSIGVTVYPQDGNCPEELVRKADLAMYHAKESGRGVFEFFDDKIDQLVSYQLDVENELRKALDGNELVVYFQPKQDTKTKSVHSVEALLRWQSKDGSFISPADFIPIAEKSGLIEVIDTWVLRQSCEQVKLWESQGLGCIRVAVNLSARQFTSENLVCTVEKVLNDVGISGDYLELEITESMLMENIDKVIVVLNKLRALGVTIAIDDFGTGYSSLNYLQKLPIDSIKIDRSFVREYEEDTGNNLIVNAIISLGHSLNLTVVAEGAEKLCSVEYLCDQGCDYIQGYYFYKPMPAADVTSLLFKQRGC